MEVGTFIERARDFYKIVEKKRDPGTGKNTLRFPTLCACSGCGGFTGYFHDGKTVRDPEGAWLMALVQFGYSTCQHFDNLPPSHPCFCEEALDELRSPFESLPWIDCGAWKVCGGLPHRGITDYERTLHLERDLTDDEKTTVTQYLQMNKCPGWTGVRLIWTSPGRYRATTTWDSSD